MKRINTKLGRFYYDDLTGKYLPSVTTIIDRYHKKSEYLIKWIANNGYEESKEIRDKSADYGIYIHILFCHILGGDGGIDVSKIPDNYRERAKQDLYGFINWIVDYDVKPVDMELSLCGENYAGCIDLICDLTDNGKTTRAIVDFKTGRHDFYEENEIQMSGYCNLITRNYDILPAVYLYGCKDYKLPLRKNVKPYNFKRQTYNTKWDHYLKMWIEEMGEYTPVKKTIIKDNILITRFTDPRVMLTEIKEDEVDDN